MLPPTPSVDLADFERLYLDTVPLVTRTLRHFGVPGEGLDDAVQDVYLVVVRRLPSFEGRSTLTTWIYGIVRRVAVAHRRKRARRPDPTGDLEVPADSSPYEDVARLEAASLLHHLLMQLRVNRREVFVLSEVECLSCPQIAEVLDLHIETVYGRLRAARADFDRLLARHNAREDWREKRLELRDEPSEPEREKRCWAALVAVLGLPRESASAPATSSLPALSLAGGILTLAVAAALIGAGRSASDEPEPGAPQRVHRAAASPESIEPLSPSAAAPVPSSPGVPVQPAPAASARSRNGKGASRLRVRPRERASREIQRPSGERRNAGDQRTNVAAEAALLQRAHTRLRAGRLDAMDSLLIEHRRAFPAGILVREREALAVALACARQEPVALDKRAEFLRRFGDRALNKGLDSYCDAGEK
jgi:RNA polymerase sigma-70 factor (ECF subfamily)